MSSWIVASGRSNDPSPGLVTVAEMKNSGKICALLPLKTVAVSSTHAASRAGDSAP